MPEKRNFDDPLWDQATYWGRFKYFAAITDPRLNFASSATLDKAKNLRTLFIQGRAPPGVSDEQLRYAKRLYDSAFHPDTGDKMNIFGRMSFQLPGGMLLTGAMLTWYRTVPALVFWQWANQSFNALVNYTNRNAKSPLSVTQLCVAYATATTAACVAAIGTKSVLMGKTSPFFHRFVPYVAVAAANCVNIPLMRQNEITHGVPVYNEKDELLGHSKAAAVKGISQVVFSRIFMCTPGFCLTPFIMDRAERNPWFRKNVWFHAPFQITMSGLFLLVMVPAACAVFPQRSSISTRTIGHLEPACYHSIAEKAGKDNLPCKVYFNKGL